MSTFLKTYVVCKCNKVSLGEILYAIENKNAKTIEDIKKFTDAGTSCGCCISIKDDINDMKMDLHVEEILNKYKTKILK